MNKRLIKIMLIVFTTFMWLSVFTNEEDKTGETIQQLKAQAAKNEKVGLYKPNIEIYHKLLRYEEDIIWYDKLKKTYLLLDKMDEYLSECKKILEKYPDNRENVMDLFNYYYDAGRPDVVIEMYQRQIGKNCSKDEEIKKIYKDCAYQYEYEVDGLSGVENVWGDYMIVNIEGRYHYVWTSGKIAFEKSFEKAYPFISDYAAVYDQGEWFFIDKEGDKYYLVYNQEYEEVQSFSDNYAVVVKDGKYGYIDYNGKEYHIEYDYATALCYGVGAVKKGHNWYLIDSKLNKINDDVYEDVIVDSANICSRRKRIFAKKDGVWHLLDEKGKEVTKEVFEDAKPFFSDDIAPVKKNGKWGFIDYKGNIFIECQYEDANSFQCGVAPVKIDGSYEYIDKEGIVRTDLNLINAYPFTPNGYGLIEDSGGEKIITFKICQVK